MDQDELSRTQEVWFLAKFLLGQPEGRSNLTRLCGVWSGHGGVPRFIAALAQRVEQFSDGEVTIRRVSAQSLEGRVPVVHGSMAYLATCPADTPEGIKSLDDLPGGATVYQVGPYAKGCVKLKLD